MTTASAFALLRWLWAGQARASPGRALTAVVAIAIGVALALAIHLVNRSALGEFGAAIAVVNGEAQAQLKARAAGFDEGLYARVASDPRIEAASPVLEAEAIVLRDGAPGAEERAGTAVRRPSTLRVVGLDVMRAAAVTPSLLPAAGDDEVAAGAQAAVFADDTVFLSPAALTALGLRVGETLRLRVGLNEVDLRVAGTVPGAASGQRLAVMDLGAAQWRLGWLGRLSRIDLRLAPGVDAAALGAALAPTLPADVAWSAPEAEGQRMSNLSRAYRVNLNVLALVALFTGGFIVYATIALAVVRQQAQLALLGVLGGSSRLLIAVVLGEGAALGFAGALLGAAGGIGLAWGVLAVVGGDLGSGFFQGSRPALVVEAGPVLLFATIGVAVGLAGGLMPALALRRLAPARALKTGGEAPPPRRRHSLAWSALLFLAGGALLLLPPIEGLPIGAYVAIALWLFAGIAFVPVLTRAAGETLARLGPVAWRHPVLWLALQRVRGAPGSAAAALAGVVASFALASAMAVMVHSFRDSVDRWLDTVLPADVYGRSAPSGAQAAISEPLQAQLRSLPGVARADFLRSLELSLDARRPAVVLLARTLDPGRAARQLPLTGDVRTAPPGTVPVWVSEAMVDVYGMTPGSEVTLPIAPARFFVAGVWRDYSRQHGAVVIAERDYRRLTGDDTVSDVALWLAPGTDEAQVLETARAAAPELAALDFRSARDIRAISLTLFDRSFAVTYVLEAIAIVVGLFGVAATYAGEALARAREFGMLRHLGVTRAEIARLFAVESALLIGVGLAWGAAVGVAIALVLVHRVNPQSFHWTMDVAWPHALLAGSAAALMAMGVAAAVLASRSATGAAPVRAVREDW